MLNYRSKPTTIAIGLAALMLLVLPQPLKTEDFNPNYIISDERLQDYRAMGRGEIQSFLKGKNSFLATYITEDVNGKNRRAADIIYQASRDHKISPKFLLVLLQKEMSIITRQNPSDRNLDYAAGYAVCDSCSFSDPKVIKYKGFGKQVDAAAGIMRWYYDNYKAETWIRQPLSTYSIDGTQVSPANLATGFLYTYTPHIEGNENFWKIWQSWFDQVYPDGTLLQAIDSPDVYVISDGKRRLIKNTSTLISRFDPKQVVQVPLTELTRYD